MSVVFLDTSYVLALELANDQNHLTAERHWHTQRDSLPDIVTTSCVLDEVATFFNSRGHHAKAVELGERLLQSPAVDLVHVDGPLFGRAWSYFVQHHDKTYSFTDCISFVLMHERKIPVAFAFDRHFLQAGFQVLPPP